MAGPGDVQAEAARADAARPDAARPVLFVLAGVNGAGKSSIGGHLLTQAGLAWFNPTARELVREHGYGQEDANIAAWNEGVRRLDLAVRTRKTYAFETTLGGDTITQKLMAASASHDALVWFCGLRDAAQHIQRVRLRVRAADTTSPRTASASAAALAAQPHHPDAAPGAAARLRQQRRRGRGHGGAEPRLVLGMDQGRLTFPITPDDIRATPDWARRWSRPPDKSPDAARPDESENAHQLPVRPRVIHLPAWRQTRNGRQPRPHVPRPLLSVYLHVPYAHGDRPLRHRHVPAGVPDDRGQSGRRAATWSARWPPT